MKKLMVLMMMVFSVSAFAQDAAPVTSEVVAKQVNSIINKLSGLEKTIANSNALEARALAKYAPYASITMGLSKVNIAMDGEKRISEIEKRIREMTKFLEATQGEDALYKNTDRFAYDILAEDRLTLVGLYRGELAKKTDQLLSLRMAGQ